MKNPGMYIRHPKARGEWAELRFMTRATELNFIVAKPWGETAPYDVATDHHGLFRRVQGSRSNVRLRSGAHVNTTLSCAKR